MGKGAPERIFLVPDRDVHRSCGPVPDRDVHRSCGPVPDPLPPILQLWPVLLRNVTIIGSKVTVAYNSLYWPVAAFLPCRRRLFLSRILQARLLPQMNVAKFAGRLLLKGHGDNDDYGDKVVAKAISQDPEFLQLLTARLRMP